MVAVIAVVVLQGSPSTATPPCLGCVIKAYRGLQRYGKSEKRHTARVAPADRGISLFSGRPLVVRRAVADS